MNFGYLIVVATSSNANYVAMAYALVMSIKNTQKPGYDKVALVIDDIESLKEFKSTWVFDHVIQWNQETFWDGRSWMDKLTPFEHTVCLDADMLFLRDYSHWIDYFVENSDLYLPTQAYNYRGNVAADHYYRKTFRENQLPNVYSYFTFFKKDADVTKDFFELGRHIIKNPIEFSNVFLSNYKPKVLGTDEAFALSAKILGIEGEISYPLDFPKIVHMKPMLQDWPWPAEKWSDHVGFYLNNSADLKIGNYHQDSIVHYVEKDKVDEEFLSVLEERIWKK